jgi:hypothetical protein
MSLLWKRTIKHAEELLPARTSSHEAYDGMEMLRKRRMPNITREPLVMTRLAGTALRFGIYLLKLLDQMRERIRGVQSPLDRIAA